MDYGGRQFPNVSPLENQQESSSLHSVTCAEPLSLSLSPMCGAVSPHCAYVLYLFKDSFHNSYVYVILFLPVQTDDLATVVDHLRVEGTTSLIGLWGRSMGAVTA